MAAITVMRVLGGMHPSGTALRSIRTDLDRSGMSGKSNIIPQGKVVVYHHTQNQHAAGVHSVVAMALLN
jgi:hypothetical protein